MDIEKLADSLAPVIRAAVEKATAPLLARISELEARPVLKGDPGENGVDGKDGKDGEKGADGLSVTLDDVRPILEEAVKSLPVPQDGKDGRDGIDGKDGASVSLSDVEPLVQAKAAEWLEARSAAWELDFERRAQGVLERAVDRLPKPVDGKDGRDGFSFEDFTLDYDGERTITFKFERGGEVKSHSFLVPIVLDAGYYVEGESYQKHDGVTFGGSYWIAQKETTSKPEIGNEDWRLAVKKGRDGKHGENGKDYVKPTVQVPR